MPAPTVDSYVFSRALGRPCPWSGAGKARACGTATGRRYLDGSGGAVVVNIGHGREEVAAAMARQAAAAAYVHGTQFTSDVLEEYARRLARARARRLPAPVPGVGRVRGQRDRREARARLAPRARRARAGTRSCAGPSRTTAARWPRCRSPAGPNLQAPYRPLLTEQPQATAPFCYHCPLDRAYPTCEVACADDLEEVIRARGPGDDRGLPGRADPGRVRRRGRAAGGLRPPRARETCTRHGDRLHRRRGDDRLRPHRPLVRDRVERRRSRTSSPAARA